MFTGLVQAIGQVALAKVDAGAVLTVEHAFGALDVGESVAVNGICLTVASRDAGTFRAHASRETLVRTTLGAVTTGRVRVNLERALRVGDRLGGHWVSGHVDTVVAVSSVTDVGQARLLTISLPLEVRPYVAFKGSVALDGVSLTVNEVSATAFSVMLVPHTLEVTTLSELRVGAKLNLEVDVLARYAVHALAVTEKVAPDREGHLAHLLQAAGFTEVER